MRRARGARWLVLVLTGWSALAQAQVDAGGADAGDGGAGGGAATQAGRLAAAEAAERAGDVAGALALYEEARRLAPTSRLSRRAEQRLAWLGERAAGGEALAELLRVRVLQADELTLQRVRALDAGLAGLPAGLARRELSVLLAEALVRLGQAREAVAVYRRLLAEPGLGATERESATRGLAEALASAGEPAEGLRVLERAGMGQRGEASGLRVKVRRKLGRKLAWGVLLLFGGLALGLGFRGFEPRSWRGRFRWWQLGLVAYALGVPGLIAVRYDAVTRDTFGWLALFAALALLLAAVAGVGLGVARAARWRIALVATSAGLAQLAVGYLMLDQAGVKLGFGL